MAPQIIIVLGISMNRDAISEAFYNPKTGFVSAQKLYTKLKPDHPRLTLKEVQNFINEQMSGQVTKRNVAPKKYSSFQAPGIRGYYQMDLMIYDRFEYHNYKYILVVIDVYSRFAMAKALTNRTLPNLMKNIQEIFDSMGIPNNVQCDNEFNKKTFINYCNDNNIIPRFSLPDEINKNPIVERLNGTIANILQRWRVATGRHDWYKVLDDVMDNYNDNVHTTIKAKPIDVWKGKDTNHQKHKVVKYAFKVGDRVRVARSKTVFSKGDEITYSKDIFTITKIDGIRVYLDDFADWAKPYQLQKVTGPVGVYSRPEVEHAPVHRKIQSQRKLKKALNKEGVEENQVALRRSARERKPESQLEDVEYGRIKY